MGDTLNTFLHACIEVSRVATYWEKLSYVEQYHNYCDLVLQFIPHHNSVHAPCKGERAVYMNPSNKVRAVE